MLKLIMKSKNLGFTLVELLIVISLIAILSVAVIATINPVEQANKARDAQMQNDAMEYLNAVERYKASTGTWPMERYSGFKDFFQAGKEDGDRKYIALGSMSTIGFSVCGIVDKSPEDLSWNLNSNDSGGCVIGSGNNQGPLIASGELKSSFVNKSIFSLDIDQLSVSIPIDDNGQIYVCYKPKAKTNLISNKMRCLDFKFGPIKIGEDSWDGSSCDVENNKYICIP
jgi:prepilin-type N-terminal cleavage/methylation domain-containing protein